MVNYQLVIAIPLLAGEASELVFLN